MGLHSIRGGGGGRCGNTAKSQRGHKFRESKVCACAFYNGKKPKTQRVCQSLLPLAGVSPYEYRSLLRWRAPNLTSVYGVIRSDRAFSQVVKTPFEFCGRAVTTVPEEPVCAAWCVKLTSVNCVERCDLLPSGGTCAVWCVKLAFVNLAHRNLSHSQDSSAAPQLTSCEPRSPDRIKPETKAEHLRQARLRACARS